MQLPLAATQLCLAQLSPAQLNAEGPHLDSKGAMPSLLPCNL